jgi:hypothetical protein
VGAGFITLETFGAPPEPAAGRPNEAKTVPPPAPAIDFLKAGAHLFNKGQYDLAAKYLLAAERRRAQLTENERIVLDAYQDEMDRYRKRKRAKTLDPAVVTAGAVVVDPTSSGRNTTGQRGSGMAPLQAALPDEDEPQKSAASSGRILPQIPPRVSSADTKQRARWLLHEAREQLFYGNLDQAARKTNDARALRVEWGRFDDTPEKLDKSIEEARVKLAKVRPASDGSAGNDSDAPASKR